MFYIIGLFLMIALILGGFSGSLPIAINPANFAGIVGNIFDNFKNRTFEFIFPKSENVILVDKLNKNYDLLDRFFSKNTNQILNSKDIPEDQKEELKRVIKTFNQTKDQVQILGQEAVKKDPGLLESVIKKVLNIESKQETIADNPDPTSIPPQCRLECSK